MAGITGQAAKAYFESLRSDVNSTPVDYSPVQNGGYIQSPTQLPLTREERIEKIFTYQPSSLTDVPKYEAIREAAKYFAKVILKNTPNSADQTAAIRKLREAVMTANAAIALDGISL